MSLIIGNAQGFWGDRSDAAFSMAMKAPEIDYITLDYLAEISMSILAIQKKKNPSAGYAEDFVDVIHQLMPLWRSGARFKVISNAGGLNPLACGIACRKALGDLPIKISVVTGDDIHSQILEDPSRPDFCHLETGLPPTAMISTLITANAYLGAAGIIQALERGAQIVITGRVADPSMVVAPAIFHYKWKDDAWDKIAGATVAGHLIECGTQATGGISTSWLDLEQAEEMGFPLVEIFEDGSCTLTKPKDTGGAVTIDNVKEQLLYELGDPENYLSPDATVSFTNITLHEESKDRIRLSGALGRPPPEKYKVSATYDAGWKAEGMLALFGREIRKKGIRCGEILKSRLNNPENFLVECIGAGDLVPGVSIPQEPLEAMLRFAIRDRRREVVEKFAKEIAPLVTCGPQGMTGYMTGRPKVRQAFGFWPGLIERNGVAVEVHDV